MTIKIKGLIYVDPIMKLMKSDEDVPSKKNLLEAALDKVKGGFSVATEALEKINMIEKTANIWINGGGLKHFLVKELIQMKLKKEKTMEVRIKIDDINYDMIKKLIEDNTSPVVAEVIAPVLNDENLGKLLQDKWVLGTLKSVLEKKLGIGIDECVKIKGIKID